MDRRGDIEKLKRDYGRELIILAHYYQRDGVFEYADVRGDSYALALAASRSEAGQIVFCGVFFMAESASVLARKDQRVYLPEPEAGCPLADMIEPELFEHAMEEIKTGCRNEVVPVVYINSSAAVKAAVGAEGGMTCTSSNAALLVRGLLDTGKTVFFLPDKNLGINTAGSLGLATDEIAVYGRAGSKTPLGPAVRVVVWDGFCNVHVRFSPADVLRAKNAYPYARILVHPECSPEVVAAADYAGSTSGIIKECEKAKAGDVLFVGTELNLVRRLASMRPAVRVFPLRESGCVNMNKITVEKLHATLVSIRELRSPYEISIDPVIKEKASRALQAMIDRVEAERNPG